MSDDVTTRLAEIEQRANAATPGPWETRRLTLAASGEQFIDVFGDVLDRPHGRVETLVAKVEEFEENDGSTQDAEFIAHAREDVPWLIAQLREVEQAHALMAQQFTTMQAEKEHGWREAEKHEAALTRVRVLLDSLGEFADNHATHSADCHTWHPECLVIKLRRALDGEVPS